MSRSLDIVPSIAGFPAAGALREAMAAAGAAGIAFTRRDTRIEDDEPLLVHADEVVRVQDGRDDSGIRLFFSREAEPAEYAAEFAGRLSTAEAARFRDALHQVGVRVNARLGRLPTARQVAVFRSLVSALAGALDGWVVVREPHEFGVPAGAYARTEFARARLLV